MFGQGDQPAAGHTGSAGGGNPATQGTADATPQDTDGISLHDIEAQHIAALLEKHHGNRKRVADELGVSERTMYRKLKKYHLG